MAQSNMVVFPAPMKCDCIFFIGINRIKVHAHRSVLSEWSQKLCDLFDMSEEVNLILIDGINLETFESMIEYLYWKKLNIRNLDAAIELINLAQHFEVYELMNKSIDFVRCRIRNRNVVYVYKRADELNSDALKNVCLKHFRNYLNEVIEFCNNNHIKYLEIIMPMILSLDDLRIESELTVVNWITMFWTKINTAGVASIESLTSLRKCIVQVRFAHMTQQQLIEAFSLNAINLLTPQEREYIKQLVFSEGQDKILTLNGFNQTLVRRKTAKTLYFMELPVVCAWHLDNPNHIFNIYLSFSKDVDMDGLQVATQIRLEEEESDAYEEKIIGQLAIYDSNEVLGTFEHSTIVFYGGYQNVFFDHSIPLERGKTYALGLNYRAMGFYPVNENVVELGFMDNITTIGANFQSSGHLVHKIFYKTN